MSNAESTTRPPKDQSNPTKGRPGSEKRKASLQSTHSSGWGWPRFVSVEVDVEEKRRQKPHEMAPVNATGEMSRPELGARNQSLQKAHEHSPQSYLRRKPSRKPEESEDSTHTEAATAEEHQQSKQLPRSPRPERRDSGETRSIESDMTSKDEITSTQPNSPQSQAPKDEIKSTQPNSPQSQAPKDESTSSQPNSQPQAPIPNAESTEISGIAGEQPPENREDNSISPDEERSAQQGVSHRASVNSHTQDSERMAGAFPDEDNESMYSSAALEDQHDTNFHAPVEGNALHDNESIYSSAALEDQHNTNFHAPVEGNALHGFEGTIGSDSARQAESQGRRSSETARELGTQATQAGNPDTSSDAPTASIATEGPTEVDRTNESGQIDFTPAARDDNEELTRGPEAEEAESSRSTVDPSSNDQAGSPHDKQSELPPSGAKQDAVDAVSVAESETPSDRTAYRGSKVEPAEVIKRVSIPDDLVPRQPSVSTRKSSRAAKKVTLPPPKIFVQSPSDVTDQDITEPHPTPAAQPLPNDEYRIISRHGSIVSVQHTVNSAAEKLKRPRIRRRKLYIRKARNLAARPVFLNAALGRRVGRQTKERLRRLAKGEDVQSTSIKTQANPPDAPRLRKSQSFIRKARNLVARKSFLDMALGRQVSSDTKPVLRQMASGRFSIVEDGQVSEVAR